MRDETLLPLMPLPLIYFNFFCQINFLFHYERLKEELLLQFIILIINYSRDSSALNEEILDLNFDI